MPVFSDEAENSDMVKESSCVIRSIPFSSVNISGRLAVYDTVTFSVSPYRTVTGIEVVITTSSLGVSSSAVSVTAPLPAPPR